MQKFTILKYPHPFLKKVAKKVRKHDINNNHTALNNMINIMSRIMYQANGGGLAATQVGIDMSLFIMDNIEKRDHHQSIITAINPEILEKKGQIIEEEGCLSFPGVSAKVKRAKWIKMKALNILGKCYELEADGYLGRCIQHEIDHLNGITYFDHLSPLKRTMIEKKYKKLLLKNSNYEDIIPPPKHTSLS